MRNNSILIRYSSYLISTLLLAGIAFSCDDNDDNNQPVNNSQYTVSGNADGTQVVPAVAGTGAGTITGTYNPATRQLEYTSTWNGLTGAPTSGGFYTGARGTSGTAVGNPWVFSPGAAGTGSTTGTMTLTESQGRDFTSGNWYYSYGTASNPGGEIRGQVSATR